MPEILLHYIWQRGIFMGFPQQTTMGQKVEVLSVGQHNTNAGPDFTNVRVRIDGVELVGNVEIHIKSSDWYAHHHHEDIAYDSVLLHVVRVADKKVYNTRGHAIPQVELQYPNEQDYLKEWVLSAQKMDSAEGTHTCAKHLLKDPYLLTDGWRQTMLRRRLDCKSQSIHRLLELTAQDYEQTIYIMLAHQFGFHVNGVAMEQLALQTPLSVLRKHRDSLFQIQAILLGQSGLIAPKVEKEQTADEQAWWKEYTFLQKKFGLEPIPVVMWKRGRTRPQNQPEVRIRQLAQLICAQESMLSYILEHHHLQDLRELLASTGMGRESLDSLILNVFVPIKYHRGQVEEALQLLEDIPAEKNSIVAQWRLLGQRVGSAADTQALIHLYMSYCQVGQCMNCDVAYQIFVQHKDKEVKNHENG